MERDLSRFHQGIHYELYDIFGAHPVIVNGVLGTKFAVWAPNAMSVSVVGPFNEWDGRRHPMYNRQGIFELFIPGIDVGEIYKYEIKTNDGTLLMKADPFSFANELRPRNCSVITDISAFDWSDSDWMEKRAEKQRKDSPISVYELYLGSFARSDEYEYLNYRDLADKIIPYIKDMGYTHVELMPIMEHPLDGSWGYQITGYYAPTSRYGSPKDFAAFVDKLHNVGIGVLLDWVPGHFPKDEFGLACFDGTYLYEHPDERRREHPHWGTFVFDYGKPEVSNFLIANALFWIEKYHVDGLRFDAVASMLYLDYGRESNEWMPNMYGGRDHLEAVEFIKYANSIIHKRNPDVLTIAEESTAWPMVTGNLEHGGLGFDYKWNMGYMHDFLEYIGNFPYLRPKVHNKLTFSMVYAYHEAFMLAFSHDEAVHGKGTMLGKMPGDEASRFAALRTTYAYMMMHPGKKLLFMGQDIGEYEEFSEHRTVRFDLLRYPYHNGVNLLVKDLNKLYTTNPALTELDQSPEGFSWINFTNPKEGIVSFVRKGKDKNSALFVVANFGGRTRDISAGVPWEGYYKEIINTDAIKYGGSGIVNARIKTTGKQSIDGQENFIPLKIASQSVAIFEYMSDTDVIK